MDVTPLRPFRAGRVDCGVVYKVDRLSRSLLDFTRLMESFERHRVSFVSVTQPFNTASPMGYPTVQDVGSPDRYCLSTPLAARQPWRT